METIAMNVNANGIVAVNNGKKDDSPSLPSSGLRNFLRQGVSGTTTVTALTSR
jgi:hypothetical protein